MHTTHFNIDYILYICYMSKTFSLLSLCVVALLALTSSSCQKEDMPPKNPGDTVVIR
jgi:hypothetical protein